MAYHWFTPIFFTSELAISAIGQKPVARNRLARWTIPKGSPQSQPKPPEAQMLTGWCPPVITWCINPITYRYIMLYLP